MVGPKPAPGHEAAGWAVLARAIADGGKGPAMTRWLSLPKVASWEVVDAPVIGVDEAANRWALCTLRGLPHDPAIDLSSATPDEMARIQQATGRYVLQLAPVGDGLPVYSHALMNKGLELTSFRAQFLADARAVIGDDLWEAAHHRMLPDAFRAFLHALEDRAAPWIAARGLTAAASVRSPPAVHHGPDAAVAHVLMSAVRWGRFWGDRGFWLDTWS